MVIRIGLALWAICYLLVYEDGPFDVLKMFREWAGVKVEESGIRHSDQFLGQLLNCPVCLSVWLAIPLTLIDMINQCVLVPLAAVGIVIILSGVFSGDS